MRRAVPLLLAASAFALGSCPGRLARDAASSDGPASDVTLSYPPGPYGPYLTNTIANFAFPTASGSVSLEQWYTPRASVPRLLVLRVMAAWSGPSQFAAAHTARLRALAPDRTTFVDILVLGRDNRPATLDELASWRARYDALPDVLAIDPEYRIDPRTLGAPQLPGVVFVDPRTMTITQGFTFPDFVELANEVDRQLALFDGRTAPAPRPLVLHDGDRFADDRWELVRAMGGPLTPPPDPTNRVADDPAAASLGGDLFAEVSLSRSGTFSCASCHQPSRRFTDGRATGLAVGTGTRNTPTARFASQTRWQFWDGRADSLWSQALGPIENPIEMNSSRLRVAHVLGAAAYRARYEALFGALPPLSDTTRFPADGKPGDAAWEAMAPDDRSAIDRVYSNAGKAIEAFERSLATGPAPIDAYAGGTLTALTVSQRDGLREFMDFGCIQCHHGPRLSDDSFHNLWMPSGPPGSPVDPGRIEGVPRLLASAFRADGVFSDAPGESEHLRDLAAGELMRGQFHTPTLRDVAETGPWGHAGTFADLASVMRHYATRVTARPDATTTGVLDRHLPGFHANEAGMIQPLVDLMAAFTTR